MCCVCAGHRWCGVRVPASLVLVLLAAAYGASTKTIVLNDTKDAVEVEPNESLKLLCGLNQTNQATVTRWFKDGQLLDVAKKKNVQMRRIKSFQARDAGRYSCQHDGYEKEELSVTLRSRIPYEETREYQSDAGKKRDIPASLKNTSRRTENTTGYMKRNIEKYGSQVDKVEASHTDGKIQETDNRTDVKFAPRFKHPLKMYALNVKPVGSSVKFKCIAEGNPTPNITWFKNGGLPITRPYFVPSFSKWAIFLLELTTADNGNYTCVVCNELSCIQHTVLLHVQERYPSKPYIKEGYPGNLTAVVFNTVALSCPTVSDLEPYQYWIRPNNNSLREVDVGANNSHVPVGDLIKSQNPLDEPDKLTIYNVTKEDEGWYVCVAINTLGNTNAKGYLTVLEQRQSDAVTKMDIQESLKDMSQRTKNTSSDLKRNNEKDGSKVNKDKDSHTNPKIQETDKLN